MMMMMTTASGNQQHQPTAAWTFSSIRVQLSHPTVVSPPAPAVVIIRQANLFALLLLPLLCAVGLLGNAMVGIAIYSDRRLHNVTNYFLFSLAMADLLVCTLVMPLSIVVEVRNGVWTWSFSLCLLYVYADVFLCSASIVHMSIISLDRYLGISQPLKTRNKSRTMITLKIGAAWVTTVLISCPLAVSALIDPANILVDNTCTINNRYFMIYGSTLSFLIPFVVMVVTYVRTTSLLRQQASLLIQKSTTTSAGGVTGGDGLRRTVANRRMLSRKTSSQNRHTVQQQPSSSREHQYSGNLSYASINATNNNRSLDRDNTIEINSIEDIEPIGDDTRSTPDRCRRSYSTEDSHSLLNARLARFRCHMSTMRSAIASRMMGDGSIGRRRRRSTFQTASQELAAEHKATRVLAVVFVCFFICWTPFFVTNFTLGFCGAAHCSIPPALASIFLWLGYFSSTINPVIYTIFNRRFREAFLRILRCQCHRSPHDSSFYSRQATTYLPPDATTTLDSYRNNNAMVSAAGVGNNSIRGEFQRLQSQTTITSASSVHAPIRRPMRECMASSSSSSSTTSASYSAAPEMLRDDEEEDSWLTAPTTQVHYYSNGQIVLMQQRDRTESRSQLMLIDDDETLTRRQSSSAAITYGYGDGASSMYRSASTGHFQGAPKPKPTTAADLTVYVRDDGVAWSESESLALLAGHVLQRNACRETFL